MEGMLTTAEVAERLGMKHKESVSVYIKRGLIHAEKHGRDFVITEAEVERFIRERKTHAGGWPKGKKRGPLARPHTGGKPRKKPPV